ncbi:MAG: 3',5'-cyclic-AMP phosphodiesterase [Pseudomonadota bacterium]|nr:3',5'-cyclic-AMP phosphodiesterase [Pseudomonadota bacterium]
MPKKPLKLLHVTDPHLCARPESRMRGLNTYDTLLAVIEQVRTGKLRPDAVLATGDLVQDGTREGYERIKKLLESLAVPVHCIPGNHDAPRIMAEMLNTPPLQFCGTATYGNWCIIMLNSTRSGDDGGWLDKDQLEFLDRTLASNSANHALVCLHHHPVPMGSRWLDEIGLRNSDEFLKIIDRHQQVRGIVWGHVHQASDRRRKNVRLFSSPSTGSQFLPNSDDFALDSRPPGYRWLELRGSGSIDTSVVWLQE